MFASALDQGGGVALVALGQGRGVALVALGQGRGVALVALGQGGGAGLVPRGQRRRVLAGALAELLLVRLAQPRHGLLVLGGVRLRARGMRFLGPGQRGGGLLGSSRRALADGPNLALRSGQVGLEARHLPVQLLATRQGRVLVGVEPGRLLAHAQHLLLE
jgi:hypothetical protein